MGKGRRVRRGHSHAKVQKVDKVVVDLDAEATTEEEGEEDIIRKVYNDISLTQGELNSLREKASQEKQVIEVKYNELQKPCYEKRATLIKKIPNFWGNAMINHPKLSMLIGEEEERCMHFLSKFQVEELDKPENGFRLKFVFDENPYFGNAELVKEFQFKPNTKPKSTSTQIQWKRNMDLSKKHKAIAQKRRKMGLGVVSFFSWFSDNTQSAETNQLAVVIKDELWPNPLQYYLLPEDDDDDDTSDDDEDSDSDGEGDSDSDGDIIFIAETKAAGVDKGNGNEKEKKTKTLGKV